MLVLFPTLPVLVLLFDLANRYGSCWCTPSIVRFFRLDPFVYFDEGDDDENDGDDAPLLRSPILLPLLLPPLWLLPVLPSVVLDLLPLLLLLFEDVDMLSEPDDGPLPDGGPPCPE